MVDYIFPLVIINISFVINIPHISIYFLRTSL